MICSVTHVKSSATYIHWGMLKMCFKNCHARQDRPPFTVIFQSKTWLTVLLANYAFLIGEISKGCSQLFLTPNGDRYISAIKPVPFVIVILAHLTTTPVLFTDSKCLILKESTGRPESSTHPCLPWSQTVLDIEGIYPTYLFVFVALGKGQFSAELQDECVFSYFK